MNKITDVCVMDDDKTGFGVYYRTSFVASGFRPQESLTWKLFDTGYSQADAVEQANQLLGQTFDVLADYPGDGTSYGDYFGAFNAPFVYRRRGGEGETGE